MNGTGSIQDRKKLFETQQPSPVGAITPKKNVAPAPVGQRFGNPPPQAPQPRPLVPVPMNSNNAGSTTPVSQQRFQSPAPTPTPVPPPKHNSSKPSKLKTIKEASTPFFRGAAGTFTTVMNGIGDGVSSVLKPQPTVITIYQTPQPQQTTPKYTSQPAQVAPKPAPPSQQSTPYQFANSNQPTTPKYTPAKVAPKPAPPSQQSAPYQFSNSPSTQQTIPQYAPHTTIVAPPAPRPAVKVPDPSVQVAPPPLNAPAYQQNAYAVNVRDRQMKGELNVSQMQDLQRQHPEIIGYLGAMNSDIKSRGAQFRADFREFDPNGYKQYTRNLELVDNLYYSNTPGLSEVKCYGQIDKSSLPYYCAWAVNARGEKYFPKKVKTKEEHAKDIKGFLKIFI